MALIGVRSPDEVVDARGVAVRGSLAASIRPTITWQAVFAGTIVALAIELVLAILGVAVGLAVAHPGGGGAGDNGLGLAAGIWWIVSAIISIAFGSYVGARLANLPARFDGFLHGLTIWGLSVLVAIYVLSMAASGLVHGVITALGGTISSVSRGIETTAPQIASAFGTGPEDMQREAESLFEPANASPGQMNRQQAVSEIARLVPDLLAGGDKATAAQNRIVAILAAQLGISPDEAKQRVAQWQQRLADMKAQASQTAKTVAGKSAGIASDAAFAIFVALVVTGLAAGIGGALARPRRPMLRDWHE
ncbi:MAG TPA: hypothetical protein VLI93_16785 [Acetobacteraceae bacterium]|nr:hypothetical protein [Acetobacteraceae bacterium]